MFKKLIGFSLLLLVIVGCAPQKRLFFYNEAMPPQVFTPNASQGFLDHPPLYIPKGDRKTIFVYSPHFTLAIPNAMDMTGRSADLQRSLADILSTEMFNPQNKPEKAKGRRIDILDRGALVNLDTEIILEFLSKKSDYSGEENKGTAGKPDKSSAASTVAIPYQGNLKRNQIDEDTKRLKEYLEKADGILLTYITSRSCNEKGGRFEIDYRIVLNKNIHKQIVLLAGSRSIKYKRSTSREIIYEREDIGGIAQQIYDAMTPLVEGSRDARVVKFDPPFIVIDFGKENNLIPGMIGYVVEWDRSILHRQGKNTTMHYSYIAEFLVTDVFPTTSKALLIPPDPESPDYEWPVKVDDVVKIK